MTVSSVCRFFFLGISLLGKNIFFLLWMKSLYKMTNGAGKDEQKVSCYQVFLIDGCIQQKSRRRHRRLCKKEWLDIYSTR